MDKSRVCKTKTINPADKKGADKKTNLLVYEKPKCPPEPKVKYNVPPIPAPPAKTIRVCTGAELKKICPPPVCDCKPKKPSLGFLSMCGKTATFGLKSVLAAALVYWTWNQGIWGTPEETEEFYKNTCATLLPMICTEKPKKKKKMKKNLSNYCEAEQENIHDRNKDLEQSNIPPQCAKRMSTEKTYFSLTQIWNKGVNVVFEGVASFPTNIYNYVHNKVRPAKECIRNPKED